LSPAGISLRIWRGQVTLRRFSPVGVGEAKEKTGMETVLLSRLKEVIDLYEIGELVAVERNKRGFVNTCYMIETRDANKQHRYFVRKYKPGIRAEELQFEHALIDHLTKRGSCDVAPVVRTRDGRPFVHHFESSDDREGAYYGLFDFLPGEDRYTWVSPDCSDEEIASAALILAQFHQAVWGFTPPGRRHEPKIIDLLPLVADAARGCIEKSKDTAFDAYLAENLATICGNVRHTQQALARPGYQDLIQLVIHCDFHPGNLKFEGNRATCLFDFDWSKIDVRCFDVALALYYFFADWREASDGSIKLGGVARFLAAYQDALAGLAGVGPLRDAELEFMPSMLHASNLYVLNWTIVDFYRKELDVDEYLRYLRHGIRAIRWLEDENNRQQLVHMLEAVRT
jgi:homoserine kinase type II